LARDLVLLGAGASVDAGVPSAFAMTDAIQRRLHGRRAGAVDLGRVLEYVCEGLRLPGGAVGEEPPGLDVEKVFSAVEMLATRERIELFPFVRRWDDEVARWERAAESPENVYAALRKGMLAGLQEEVATTQKEISYLWPLLRLAADPERAEIVTLNYDLAVEGAGEGIGVKVHTGIDGWVGTGRWEWPERGPRLIKLHGSIDWVWQDDRAVDGRLPSRYVVQTPNPAEEQRPLAVVFGLRGKLRAEGPFLSALAEFEARLEGASRLVAIGYSFRDDHVNQVIRRWTFEDRAREVVLVDPGLPGEMPAPRANLTFRESLLAFLRQEPDAKGDRTRIRLVRKPAKEAIPELFS
jgi:SIR2-like domain